MGSCGWIPIQVRSAQCNISNEFLYHPQTLVVDWRVVDLRQLRYFLAVVEYGTFTRAAAAIGCTQQALSKGIGALEQRLGEHVFSRGTRHVELTRAGRLLLDHARTIHEAVADFEDRLTDLQTGSEGLIRIGAGPSTAGSLLAPAVIALRRQWPRIRAQVSDGIAQELLPALLARRLDLVVSLHTLGDDEVDPRITGEVLLHDEYRVMAAAGHPLAGVRGVKLEQLLGHPWIFGRRLGAVEQVFHGAFRRRGLAPPAHAMESDSLEFLRAMVTDGGHLTLLPRRLAQPQLRQGQWRELVVPGFAYRSPVRLYTRIHEPQSAPMAKLLHNLRSNAAAWAHGTG